MAEIMDDVAHLTQEIGPHPAGTEEEQQAALYLAEELQKESGFTSIIEDFQCITNPMIPTLVCFGIALVAVIVSIVMPVAGIPCFIFLALAAVLFVMEVLGKPVISRFLKTGASQNVVAKYQPSQVGGVTRRRKIILVANYDSGKVLKEEDLPIAGVLPLLQKAAVIALVVAAVLLLLRVTIFATDTGAASSVITMLLVICAILFAIPLVRAILFLAAPYSQSANNNAAGVSVLLDVARQVGNGLVSNEEAMQRAEAEGGRIHDEAAAREAGVVPEGASLEYDTANMNPQESLAAAKAAIAALTGKPVADKVPVTDISSRLVKGGGLEPTDEEAISSVHFEVSEPVKLHPEKQNHFRTMVSSDEPEPEVPVADQEEEPHEEERPNYVVPSHKVQQSLEEAQAREEAEARQREEREAIERPAPMSMIDNPHPVDKTPAWAKVAQEKARKNKPEESQPHKVGRSRYADTVAAHLADNVVERQRAFEAQAAAQEAEQKEPETENSKLASRLAALRSEIEATPAPHIPDSTQAMLDTMAPAEGKSAQGADAAQAQGADVAQTQSAREQTQSAQVESTQASSVQMPVAQQVVNPQVTNPQVAPAPGVATRAAVTPAASAAAPVDASTTAPVAPVQPSQEEDLGHTVAMPAVDVSSFVQDANAQGEADAANAESHQVQENEPHHRTGKKPHAGFSRGSQSLRKTASDAPHAFASKLKSFTEHTLKRDHHDDADRAEMDQYAQQPDAELQDETTVLSQDDVLAQSTETVSPSTETPRGVSRETQAADDQAQQETVSREKGHRLTTRRHRSGVAAQASQSQTAQAAPSPEGAVSAMEGSAAQTAAAQTAEPAAKKTPVSPTETAAISPIDVSRFMNKETLEEESFDDGYSADPNEYYPQDFNEGAYVEVDDSGVMPAATPAQATQSGPSQEMASEETQRVSSEQIQEAINEASAHEPEIEQELAQNPAPARPASPIVGMEDMIPQVPQSDQKQAKRQVIVLPDVIPSHTNGAEHPNAQRAPMAATTVDSKAGSKALLSNMLPRIDSSDIAHENGKDGDSFGLNLPSLDVTGSNSAVSATGSFSTVGATGSFTPVGDELVADIDPEERYVDDADDSAYDEDYTETGAYAGRGYVEMPKSRAGRLFSHFHRKKKKEQETSVNDWVNVDDSYTAQSVGKARGDWTSFREENEDQTTVIPKTEDEGFVDVDYHETDFDNRRGWNGGAFSLNRLRKGQAAPAGEDMADQPYDEAAYAEDGPMQQPMAQGNDAGLIDTNPAVRLDGDASTAEQINRELRKLQDFRHPDINTEVWFVALGAEQYSHSGIDAFLEDHADEMKGAVIVNLEALGAGTLSIVEQEGWFKSHRPSSRIKRFIRQASDRSGVAYRTAVLNRRDTPATKAMAKGIQAVTVAGMGDGNTALYSAENDIIENIDQDMVQDAAKFVMAILKSI